MSKEQKETLRDCFEGCYPLIYAIEIIVANKRAANDAMRTWARWQREMEEEGYYTY